jgi:DNA-binding transcriptional LysR family regulator
LSPRVKREIETADALFAFAAEGEGVTILSFSMIYQEIAQGMAIARKIINPEINRSLWLPVAPKCKEAFVGDMTRMIRDVIHETRRVANWN